MKLRFSIVFLLLMSVIGQNVIADSNYNDIRVVIDVSGSMKQTDPLNLRIPAMKMLNGLVPDGSYAGVWNFGRHVNMTVKWGKVDTAWRNQADIGAAKIHSNGLFTDIESALARSTLGWENPDTKVQRSIILLTDGQVDISKDSAKNKVSRISILTDSIQALKKSGVKVHAIALSKDADETLLKNLALETGGSFEIAESAQALQKIFLKLFERATSPDMIELKGNKFTIDKSVKEMTLLIFRPKDSKVTQLYPPGESTISSSLKGESSWRIEEGYDLITIKKPKVGVWTIDAYNDPDNRLMVVTDLTLKLSDVPAYITPSQTLSIAAEIHNKGKKITKSSFLDLVKFDLNHIDENDNDNPVELAHSEEIINKGRYAHLFDGSLSEGRHSFIVSIDSQTFNRNKRVDVEVQWPVKVTIKPKSVPGIYHISIQAREEYLKPDSLQPNVQIKAPDGLQLELELNNTANIWEAELNANQAGLYQALIQVSGLSINGEKQQYDLGMFSMVGVYRAPDNEVKPVPELTTVTDLDSIQTVTPLPEGKTNWKKIIIIIGVSNLTLILIAGSLFFIVRRRSNKVAFSLDEELSDETKPTEESFNV